MQMFDLRTYKLDLRKKYKKTRIDMSEQEKQTRDNKIFDKFVNLRYYKKADLVLSFISTEIEVDTYSIIKQCWKDGKRVAVPRCVEGTRLMYFYEITDFSQLEKHSFGVMEPIPSICKQLKDFENSICIVPGLVFDNAGYRLGYGKGYYDRFLSNYDGIKVGICYSNCIKYSLRHGKYDVASNVVINDKYINFVDGKE